MNRVFKTIWSVATQSWQAVPETARTSGKKSVKSRTTGTVVSMSLGLTLGGAGAQSPPPPASTQLPMGGSVARGSATISQTATAQAAAMTVNQSSQRAIINWDSFNLGTAASINFVQPNAQAVTLNRVNDNNPSQIFGRITSNGQVFLSNPSGVYFSPTASVDVGALVATSHGISDANFMAGNYQFERNGATGKVVNEGRISAGLGGYVALLAPEVQNAGVVLARAGTVALAAGEVISLQVQGGGLAGITTTPNAIATLIENKLAVQAPDGQIILSAVALNKLQAGVIKNSGSLEANSLVAKGGKIYLEADDITLAATSRIEAKGPTGGGTVLVGGDWQGSGEMRQATKVTMEAGARIDASATDQGDGGKVVLWSDIHNADSVTRVNGSIQAEAGPNGGNGGQVETSGHRLEVGEAVVSAQSFKGKDGLWLLDPYNITISSGANASTTNASNTFTSSASGGVVNATTLQNALATSSVTVSTTGAGTDAGNITVSSDLSWSSNKVLTLTANGGINGTGNIAMSGASGTGVVFNQAGNSIYSGNISGTNATVTKQGVGELTLSGNNTYGGITTVSAGTLKIGSSTALGAATNSTDYTEIATGATLDLNSFSLNERLLISGTLTNSSVNAVTAYTGTTQLIGTVGTAVVIQADAGAINLAAMLGVPPNGVELGGSTGGSFSGIIGASNSNQPKVTKNGSGTWAFNGTESYLRDVLTIQAGTLKLGSLNTNFFGNIVTGVNISTAGAVLEMANNNALNVTKPIYGSGSVLKSGAGTLTLNSSSNAYSGGTTVANGILKAGTVFGGSSSAHLGTGRVTVMSGAALDVQGNSLSVPITINGTGINSGGALTNGTSGTSDVTLSGLLTLGSDSAIVNNASGNSALKLTNVGTITGNGYALTLGGSQGGTISSIIGTGSGSITKTGAGTWTLSGVNTFTGNVFVNEGYLIANNSNALGTAAGYTQVASGASLGIVGATDFTEPLNLSGFGYSDTVAALHSQTTATLNYTGTMTLTGTTRIGVTSGKTLNIKTSVDNGVYDIVKYSTGTLNFQGTPQTGVAAASIGLSGTGTLKTGSAFVKATGSTSVYGSSPVISYQIYSTAAATTLATGLPSITGTAVFTGAPTGSSSVGSYSLKYDKGLSSTYAFFPVTAASTWVVGQAPLTITANNASKTYDGLAYTGGNGVSYSAFANNETTAVLGGTLSYGGTSQGATNAGSYAITPSGLTSANYAITYANGTLTINKAALTVTANNAS
ncbi:MAG: filamentous hemagglutinin N-terminal domain-containing protein, partial [Betaproteobacteria bacterium]|nr:filamentous hemagglutinin N-terminal domain-containing protein [Betaproteobacteria bacterium]